MAVSFFNASPLYAAPQETGLSCAVFRNDIAAEDENSPQSSLSVVRLPLGAKVVRAYLDWTGEVLPVSSADTTVELILPGGRVREIHADAVGSALESGLVYSCRADVTKYVRSRGLYRIQGLELDPIRGKTDRPGSVLGSWRVVLVYRLPRFLSSGVLFVFCSAVGTAVGCLLVALGWLGVALKSLLGGVSSFLTLFFIGYALLVNLAYLGLTLAAGRAAGKSSSGEGTGAAAAIPVSLLISAYDEEGTLPETLAAALKLEYPEYEIIVINDGSRDRTLDILKGKFLLRERKAVWSGGIRTARIRAVYQSESFPRLRVIDKENSGKADSLNAGLNLSRFPLFCTMDADTIPEKDALLELACPLLREPEGVVGATGTLRLRNGCVVRDGVILKRGLPQGFLARMQVLEYIRAYSIGRAGWDFFSAQVIVSGALSLYRRDWVVRLGGYHRYAIGEDVELNMRLQKALSETGKKHRIAYAFSARCLTQAPVDLASLARQRARWQEGLLSLVRLNSRMMFNPRYGLVGMVALPFYALLELPAPFLELFGYVLAPILALFGMLDVGAMLLLLGLVWLYGSGLSLFAVLLDKKYFRFYSDREYKKLLFYPFWEGFGFHQMTVLWRLGGIWNHLKQVRLRGMGWRSPVRVGAV